MVGNTVNARIMSQHLGKDEADIVRRLRMMQKSGLVESAWGSRLGKNVKLYSLLASGFDVNIRQDGITIAYNRRHAQDLASNSKGRKNPSFH